VLKENFRVVDSNSRMDVRLAQSADTSPLRANSIALRVLLGVTLMGPLRMEIPSVTPVKRERMPMSKIQ